jgi:hypothetical protein
MKNRESNSIEHLLTGFFKSIGLVTITLWAVAINMYLLYALCVAMVPSIVSAASKEDYLLVIAQITLMYLVLRNLSRVAIGMRNRICDFVGISIPDSVSSGRA